MEFAFWAAPAASFIICLGRSDLGRTASANAWAFGLAVLAAFRSFAIDHRPRVISALAPRS